MADQYDDRDHIKLDADGGYYSRHVNAMTTECLDLKSDIAAELAWRDREIDRLLRHLGHLANTVIELGHLDPGDRFVRDSKLHTVKSLDESGSASGGPVVVDEQGEESTVWAGELVVRVEGGGE